MGITRKPSGEDLDRFFFANPKLRRYARKKAHQTPGPPKVRYRVLPFRKGPPSARTLRGVRRR